MLDYNSLSDEEKRILRESLGINRVNIYSLEDRNMMLMKPAELFEYIYLDEIEKYKEAMIFIRNISELEIRAEDVGKKVLQKLLDANDKVIKLSDRAYLYKDS